MESKISTCKIYDLNIFEKLIDGVQAAACMISDVPPVVDEASVVGRVGELILGTGPGSCSSCGAGPFSTRLLQTHHYRSRWHTYNLRRRLLGKRPVTEEEFQVRDDGGSSTSSDSDSDSEEAVKKGPGEVSELFLAATRHCRAYFTNKQGQVLSVYRCLLHHKKDCIGGDGVGERWVGACKGLLSQGGWAVFMSSGGHFAGAVFRGQSGIPIKHKTFHAYVSRRGQGKAQLTKDAQGNAPRSAGASLRRYNQEKFIQYVQEVLTSWKEDLQACSLLLYRAVGPLNQRSLFGPGSPLNKMDKRLRTLPFPTRRPSHREVIRAHSILATVEIYDTVEVFQKSLCMPSPKIPNEPSDKSNIRTSRVKKTSPVKLDRAKSREMAVRPLPEGPPMSSEDETPKYQPTTCPPNWTATLSEYDKSINKKSKENDGVNVPAVVGKITNKLNNLDMVGTLEEFDDSIKRGKNNKKNKKKNQELKQKKEEREAQRTKDEISVVVENERMRGEVDKVKRAKNLQNGEEQRPKNFKGSKSGQRKIPECVQKLWDSVSNGGELMNCLLESWEGPMDLCDSLNTPDPDDGNTALHKAAVAELPEVITLFLGAGADPCKKNILLQTPYTVTNHADSRIAFRLFQGAHPDMYNYAKAHIPGPLTLEMLEQEKEKKAAIKKAKRQKDKEKLQEKIKVSKFLELNDKQKISATSEKRCFSCGAGLDSKPFQYDDFKFCSIKCLQNHRNARPLKLSAQ